MKKNILACIFLISLNSVADDKYLDIPITAPLSENVETSSPTVSDFYRECLNGANSEETKVSRSEWSSCGGFVNAAMQAASNQGKGTCRPISLRQLLSVINSTNKEYETKHSDPFYDKNGNLSGSTLHSDFVDPWKSPALPAVVHALKVLGCK